MKTETGFEERIMKLNFHEAILSENVNIFSGIPKTFSFGISQIFHIKFIFVIVFTLLCKILHGVHKWNFIEHVLE